MVLSIHSRDFSRAPPANHSPKRFPLSLGAAIKVSRTEGLGELLCSRYGFFFDLLELWHQWQRTWEGVNTPLHSVREQYPRHCGSPRFTRIMKSFHV
jgi:hypothetical protein